MTKAEPGKIDVSIFRVHDDGREERLPSYEEALALLGGDPLAALEAAERRLLEAGGYQPEPNESAWWRSRSGVLTARDEAVSIVRHEFQIERRRLAAKGGV